MQLGGQGIIGVHLDGKVPVGVDELEQQGEFVTGVGIDVFAHQLSFVHFNQFRDGFPGQGAVGHHAHKSFNAREFPAFTDIRVLGYNTLVGCYFLPAPNERGQKGLEFHRIHATNIQKILVQSDSSC